MNQTPGHHEEPNIVVNGHQLTVGQVMTLQVALTTFAIDLGNKRLLMELGEIGPLYLERMREINRLLHPKLYEEKPR